MDGAKDCKSPSASQPVAAYATAVAGTLAAVLVRWGLSNSVGEMSPFLTFYPIVVLSAALGGTRPGLLATCLTALAENFFFMEPREKLAILSPADATALGLYIAINIAISLLGGAAPTRRPNHAGI